MTTESFAFLSPEWIDAVRGVVETLLADVPLGGADFTISEEVTDPPAELIEGRAEPVGWFLRIRDGRIDIGSDPAANADFRLIADYETHHVLACRIWDGDPDAIARSRALRAEAVAAGQLRTEGDFSHAPDIVRDLIPRLHDPVARLTA
jgi:hypothetical protein